MIELNHVNRQRSYPLSRLAPVVREAASHALYKLPFVQGLMEEGIEVSLDWTLVGPRTMRQINREQRGIDQETDILSFPAREMAEGKPAAAIEDWEFIGRTGEPGSLFLGDLVISPSRLDRQAAEAGRSLEEELRHLVIHGILHLLGYDHGTDQEAARMEALQNKLMGGLEEVPCGFVALAGRPNVGKSTLLNELSDRTLAITSPKPQTTRQAIRSVLTGDHYQIALLDTPGLHQPRNALGKAMMKSATRAAGQADLLVVLVDAAWKPFVGQMELRVIEEAKRDGKPVILAINKIDRSPKENILALIGAYDEKLKLDAYVPLSALTGDGVDRLLDEMVRLLPVRRRLFDLEDETDQTERMLAAELIRREVLTQTGQEVPYGVNVQIESFEEEGDEGGEDRQVTISALIICERESHKQILIGRGGSRIKSIGSAARQSIGKLLDARVHLSLFVKVKPNWQNRPQDLLDAGLTGRD